MASDYLARVQRRRRRRTWSRRATTGAWLVAIVGLYALWQFFPDFTASAATESTAAGGPVDGRDVDDFTLEDLDATTFDDLSFDDRTLHDPPPDTSLSVAVIGDWAPPLPNLTRDRALRPHHDYPAWDYGVAVGTDVFAMTWGTVTTAVDDDNARCGGTVTIRTDPDGAQMTYCHLSAVFVASGDSVGPGDLLGYSGGQPGAPGAGNTTGPHLHLQIRHDSTLRCPQTQLAALFDGDSVPMDDLAMSGCIRSASSRFINLD